MGDGWVARGWYQGCGARPVKISSQARISASPAARQREEEIAADAARERVREREKGEQRERERGAQLSLGYERGWGGRNVYRRVDETEVGWLFVSLRGGREF